MYYTKLENLNEMEAERKDALHAHTDNFLSNGLRKAPDPQTNGSFYHLISSHSSGKTVLLFI